MFCFRGPRGRIAVAAAVPALMAAFVLGAGAPAVHAEPIGAVAPSGLPAPAPTPVTDHCPHRVSPPPPVDASEAVAPGSTSPTPLPVPTPAVGGDRLSACGVVHEPAAGPLPQHLTSAGWLIADLDSGAVIAAKDPHGRYRPASTIKVLLALVALERLDPGTVVTGTMTDYTIEGDSCGIGPGGRYTVRDLLTGLLMVSGNDCANALARSLGGYDRTLAAMNAEAAALGARDTRAASPSGLDAPGMSTSPYDLALIFRAAMADADFRHMIGLTTHRFPGFPRMPDVPGDTDHPAYTMGTSNALLRDGYPGMLGGKTGYTDDALKTFVGAMERNGRRVLVVQMAGLNAPGDSYFDQALRMFDYGLAAPPNTSVGTLVSPASEHAGRTPPAASDASSVWGRRVVVGGSVVLLAGAGILLVLRSRRRGR